MLSILSAVRASQVYRGLPVRLSSLTASRSVPSMTLRLTRTATGWMWETAADRGRGWRRGGRVRYGRRRHEVGVRCRQGMSSGHSLGHVPGGSVTQARMQDLLMSSTGQPVGQPGLGEPGGPVGYALVLGDPAPGDAGLAGHGDVDGLAAGRAGQRPGGGAPHPHPHPHPDRAAVPGAVLDGGRQVRYCLVDAAAVRAPRPSPLRGLPASASAMRRPVSR
jgi:hypothetical protein